MSTTENTVKQHDEHPGVEMPPVQPPEGFKPKMSLNKKIVIIVITAFVALCIFATALTLGILSVIRNHPAHQTALQYIEEHPGVLALAGEIQGFGFFPNGSVSTSSGRGDADFIIRVNGSENVVRVHIQLIREPLRDWEVVSFYYRK